MVWMLTDQIDKTYKYESAAYIVKLPAYTIEFANRFSSMLLYMSKQDVL